MGENMTVLSGVSAGVGWDNKNVLGVNGVVYRHDALVRLVC